jgi:hypothetical protein
MHELSIERARLSIFCISLIAIGLARCASAQLVVASWGLATGVQDLSFSGGQDVADFTTVQNPFQATHTATYGPGTATTAYDFTWSGDSGSFDFTMTHAAPDLHSAAYRAISQASIFFSTTEPLIARLVGSYDYSLPVGGMDIVSTFTVYGGPGHTLQDSHQDDTWIFPAPRSGSFSVDRSILIPPGSDYGFGYTVRLTASGNTGALATGGGYFHLTFDPVPEPGAMGLLSFALLGVARRRHFRN